MKFFTFFMPRRRLADVAGHWANKNSFIFIYCFTFPRGQREVAITAAKKLTQNGKKIKIPLLSPRKVFEKYIHFFA